MEESVIAYSFIVYYFSVIAIGTFAGAYLG